jgi:hypothetical protein
MHKKLNSLPVALETLAFFHMEKGNIKNLFSLAIRNVVYGKPIIKICFTVDEIYMLIYIPISVKKIIRALLILNDRCNPGTSWHRTR